MTDRTDDNNTCDDDNSLRLFLSREEQTKNLLTQRKQELGLATREREMAEATLGRLAAESEGPADPKYIEAKVSAARTAERAAWLASSIEGLSDQLATLHQERLAVKRESLERTFARLTTARGESARKLAKVIRAYVSAVLELHIASQKLLAASPVPLNAGHAVAHVDLNRIISNEISRINPDGTRTIAGNLPGAGLSLVLNPRGLEPLEDAIAASDAYILRTIQGLSETAFRELPAPSQAPAIAAEPSEPEETTAPVAETHSAFEVMAAQPKVRMA